MAFPHPQSRKDHNGKKDKSRRRRVLRELLERTKDIAEYWDCHDDVDPAKYQSINSLSHVDLLLDGHASQTSPLLNILAMAVGSAGICSRAVSA